MPEIDDLVWKNDAQEIVLSPRAGGRVISWRYAGEERACPIFKLEGGLLRVLFGEERYPGASYLTPHQVLAREEGADGFRLHLQQYWNTANWFMRAFGWPGKASQLHLDGLLLDKIISFSAEDATLGVEMIVRNLTDDTKYLTPWLHNNFARWATQGFMARDGHREAYRETDIYWGCHEVDGARSPRAILGDAGSTTFAVLGAAPELLQGCYLQPATPACPPEVFAVSCAELRYREVTLAPGAQWHATAFLALTPSWQRWATEAPLELFARVEPATGGSAMPELSPLLDAWALPEERERGVMAFSYWDKPPFSSSERFGAAGVFAGFHQAGEVAEARVMLCPSRDISAARAELQGPPSWSLALDGGEPETTLTFPLVRHQCRALILRGPLDLSGRESVSVRISTAGQEPVVLTVPATATVEPAYPYQVKPIPTYLRERWRALWGGFPGGSAEEFREWQRAHRDRLHRHILGQISGRCPLEPRQVEQQIGPTCVREKVLIQTEPGFWIPAYVIYPKEAQGKLPAIIFYHGSGPGKQNFAGDEDPSYPRAEPAHELEYLPYRLATALNCLVYVPDLRYLGELAESNIGQFPGRFTAAGVDPQALLSWDYLCQLDYLCSRPDVDPTRIGAYGSSGGGNATGVVAALDERIGAAIVSSTGLYYLNRCTVPDDFFLHMQYRHPSGEALAAGSPIGGADLLLLAAPRPLWIVDGIEDVAASAAVEDAEAVREHWYRHACASREAIGEGYRLLGAEDRYLSTWFEGGHCAGMTFENVADWFRRWLQAAR